MRGLRKLPELWTRKRTRAHKLLGRRHTAAGVHKLPQPAPSVRIKGNRAVYTLDTCLGPGSLVAGFEVSTRGRFSGVHRGLHPGQASSAASH